MILHNDWGKLLAGEFEKEYFKKLLEFLQEAYRERVIYPAWDDIFTAFELCSYADTRVVIVGQDPYIGEGEAHGLAFSVREGVRVPPSLRNIFKEIAEDVGNISKSESASGGCLTAWSRQGVLLLNSVLTVESGKSRSHAGRGWEIFTDAVMACLNERETPIVFMLWGRDAEAKGRVITAPQHLVLTAAHPSPLARGKFFGCKHFSKANAFLQKHGLSEINWSLDV